jgi:response regulator RpfG family c-di-GMP phosphodiesterase
MISNTKNCHILYVDDEVNNLISFKATFRQHYTVHIAKSAQEGLQLLKTKPIELIITDQRMPEVTGVQFLEKVIPDFPDPIRMILTGFSDIEDIIRAINTGQVFRYITKPWDYQELKMTLDNALRFYHLQQTNRKTLAVLQNKVVQQEQVLKSFEKYVPPAVFQQAIGAIPVSV